ncbi:uncharacterized protein A1O5_03932 [Cladophialophora psammophila CBS 110553]|uniref:FAD-binding 8 domain-containing protein n=1 Tax=Cladophialophora psammophila CBS 110553 TaxID=1182543 RepID=W9X615_9EURO|nr:uncharacterized protein A1O5_03932 [Cladophialophora psammophila CBS 110553]EXJ72785.1 hypothetical protein A1O5_03932 [Cladophialophora psammophila CBS 110553]
MEVIIFYAAAAGGILLLFLARNLAGWLVRAPRVRSWAFRHLHTTLFRRRPTHSPISRIEAMLHMIYWGGTMIYNFLGIQSAADASTRAGALTTLNMIPLLFGGRISAAADAINVTRRTLDKIHKTVGTMTAAQMGLHLAFEAATRRLRFDTVGCLSILVGTATICLGLMTVLGLPVTEGSTRHFFHIVHKLLGAALLTSLWWIAPPHSPNRVFIYIAVGLYGLAVSVCLWRTFARSFSVSTGWSTAKVRKEEGLFVLDVYLPHPMEVHAGQYLYIWSPPLSPLSMLHPHCFVIAWWEGTSESTSSISLLVEERRGLANKLESSMLVEKELRLGIDGPYGMHRDSSRYETLMLFATDSGIAAQLSLLKEAVSQHQQQRTANKRIVLVWQVEKEGMSYPHGLHFRKF